MGLLTVFELDLKPIDYATFLYITEPRPTRWGCLPLGHSLVGTLLGGSVSVTVYQELITGWRSNKRA